MVFGLADAAQVIGVSLGWTCQLLRRFIHGQLAGASDAPMAGGPQRQSLSAQEEHGCFLEK